MRNLMGDYKRYIKAAKAKGANFISFNCPYCNKSIETLQAGTNEVWDSLSTCPHCEDSFVKITSGSSISTVLI